MRQFWLILFLFFTPILGLNAQAPEMVMQQGHLMSTGSVGIDLIVSADNNYLITYSETGEFKFWDYFTKRQIRTFRVKCKLGVLACTHQQLFWISRPSLSGDNNYLLTEADDNPLSFSLWNTSTGRKETVLTSNAFGEKVNFTFAKFCYKSNMIVTHGINTAKNKLEIAVLDSGRNTLKIFNYEKPLMVGSRKPFAGSNDWKVNLISVSPQLEAAAIATTSGRVYIFNMRKLKAGQPKTIVSDMEILLDSTSRIRRLCFSADAKELTIENDQGVTVWNLAKGQKIRTIEYAIQKYEIKGGSVRIPRGKMTENCGCIIRSEKKGEQIGDAEEVILLPSGKTVKRLKHNMSSVFLVDYLGDESQWFSEDGQYAFTLSVPENIRKTDLDNTDPSTDEILTNEIIMNQSSNIPNAVLDPETQDLFLGRIFNDAMIFNLATGQWNNIRKFIYPSDTAYQAHSMDGTALTFDWSPSIYLSADKKKILTIDQRVPIWFPPKAMIWDRSKQSLLKETDDFKESNDPYQVLNSAPLLRQWLNDFTPAGKWYARLSPYQESKDGQYPASFVAIIDSRSQKTTRSIYPYGQKTSIHKDDHGKLVDHTGNAPVLSPDNNHVFVRMQDGSILQFNANTGKQTNILKAHLAAARGGVKGESIYNPADALAVEKSSKYLFLSCMDSMRRAFVFQYEIASGKIIRQFGYHNAEVMSIIIHPAGHLLITTSKDNSTRFWDISTGNELAKLIVFKRDYVLTTPEGYYMASRKGAASMHYVFQRKVYLFEQFDLKYNRPDLVLKKLGIASRETIDNYYRAYQKRLERSGFDIETFTNDSVISAPPSVRINNPPAQRRLTQRDLSLSVTITDKKFNIDKIQVRINGVSILGEAGMNVKDKHSTLVNTTINLQLSAGKNIIQVSSFNEKGVESLRETIELELASVEQKPVLYLVGIGAAKYADARKNLEYAAKDATDMINLLYQKKKEYSEVKQFKLLDKDVTKQSIQRLKEELLKSHVDDEVILLYAGHGIFSKDIDYYLGTYDMDFNNPETNGLPFSVLENLMENIPARNKVMFIDACHAGGADKTEISLTQAKNKEAGKPKFRGSGNLTPVSASPVNSFELMQQTFADISYRSGATIISAARGKELAREGAGYSNGFFTFSILKGLKDKAADLNGDGKILLSELELYVSQTVSQLTNGQQQPISRSENQVKDFRIW